MSRTFVSLTVVGLALLPSLAASQDWQGAYGVLGVADVSGDHERYVGGAFGSADALEGTLTSLGVGYNFQNASWVYGGELSYATGDIVIQNVAPGNYLDGILDLKARLGYASGKVLFYGTVGWAWSKLHYSNPLVTNSPVPSDGFSLGLGMDVLVSDRMIVGLELQQRNLRIDEGDVGGFPASANENNIRAIGLRVGFRF